MLKICSQPDWLRSLFAQLYQGVIVEGDNHALEVKCNVFEDFLPNGTNDFRFPWILKAFTASNGTIIEPLNLGNQGTGCGEGQTAGNLFNDMGIDRIHIYATHEAQNSFTYFANGTPSETIPIINGYEYEIDEVFYNVADVITNQNCVNGVDDPTTCPVLPNLSGYPGGTSIGDGSPSDFAGHILTSNGSNTARVNRAARVTQHYLQNDSTRQEALVFLTAFDTPQAWRMLLGANLQHADTALIRHYLELLEDEPDSDPYLIDYYKILADVIADSRNLHQLQIAEIEALEDIARSASSAAVYAESLLAMPTLSTYIRQTLSIQISGKKPFNTVIAPVDSWLNPNPATQTITINTSKLWQYLTLYNLHGQAQITYHPSEQSQLALPEYLPNGLYIAKLVLTDGETQTVKILISK